MGFLTGNVENEPSSSGAAGVMGRLAGFKSMFSLARRQATPAPAHVSSAAGPRSASDAKQRLRSSPDAWPTDVALEDDPTVAPRQSAGEERPVSKEEPAAAGAAVGGSKAAVQPVDPEIKVVPFEVREPSLGASVVGHVTVLEGSCYVWASTEGSAAQGSLAAAVGTRFDGGMPTATPLLDGSGGAEAGGGGISVSMAQRLCKRTGRVVFVSCDLSEDSQSLVAAVEAKIVKVLKAEG